MSGTNDSVKERHKAFSTSEEVVFGLVKKAGHTPLARTKITKGYDNEVYEIKTKEEDVLYVRIRRFGETTFEQESWVANQYSKIGVPVPEIVVSSTFADRDTQREYMIQKQIGGKPLMDRRKDFTPSQLYDIYTQAGRALRQMHSVKTDGFYKRREGIWDFPDWKSVVNCNIKAREKELPLLYKQGFSNKEGNAMISCMKYYRDNFDCKEPVLCHGDFFDEHIFIDGKRSVVGVIDFGMYQGDHPIYDFARLSKWSDVDKMTALIQGYGAHPMFEKDFLLRMHLHSLGSLIGHVAHYAQNDMVPETKATVLKLHETYLHLEKAL